MVKDWSIDGAEGETILGNAHVPASPRGVVLIAHGFKGYKDYGMFPRIAAELAGRGLIAHRFNFSHSGMTNETDTFAREDLFEKDTWNRQVADLRAVIAAANDAKLDGGRLPYVMFGHSRGGVSVLLAAGRHAGDTTLPQPAGVVAVSAPSTCRSMTDEQAAALLKEGFLVSPSARTGQDLRIGKAFLTEQIDDPEGHDLLRLVGGITCPVLVAHGAKDPTVPAMCANVLAAAVGDNAEALVIPDADHVFNTPNPMPTDAAPGEQLQTLLDAVGEFAQRCAHASKQ